MTSYEVDRKDLLREKAAKIPMDFDRDDVASRANDYTARRRARADEILSEIGYDITDGDMPRFLPEAQRRTLLAQFQDNGHEDISREAMALDLMAMPDYWKQAAHDVRDIFGNQASGTTPVTGLGNEERRICSAAVNHIVGQMLARECISGDAKAAEAFGTLALLAGPHASDKDRTTLLAHTLLNSRTYNRACRSFDDLTLGMPAEANPLLADIRAAHTQPQAVHHARKLYSAKPEEFRLQFYAIQDDAIEAARIESVQTGPAPGSLDVSAEAMAGRVRLAAARRIIRQSRLDGGQTADLKKAQKAIMSLHPAIGKHSDLIMAGQMSLEMRQPFQERGADHHTARQV